MPAYDPGMSEALKSVDFEELYQQLRALPPGRRGEIIGGELVTSPRPVPLHGQGAIQIGTDVVYHFGRRPGGGDHPGGWLLLPEPELHLEAGISTHVLSPDIAGWKRERLPAAPRTAYIELAPDWICEILSPSSARYDKKEKARIYKQAGVTWYWLVDPLSRTVEALRREGEFWMRLGVWAEDDKARIEPFDAVEFDLSLWWGDVPNQQEEQK